VYRDNYVSPAGSTERLYGNALRCVRDTIPPPAGCSPDRNNITNLGTPYFKTNNTWTVPAANGKAQQIWSDVVLAPGCNKEEFNGGPTTASFTTDCRRHNNQVRTHNNYYGDLFSWCAVVTHAATLCPAPWRVPSAQDFIDLDILRGGTGENRTGNANIYTNNPWNGALGGECTRSGTIQGAGNSGHYWSLNEHSSSEARSLLFGSNLLQPQKNGTKAFGHLLRCVR
jgi:uncharacterized protein (TIGR02145 family)